MTPLDRAALADALAPADPRCLRGVRDQPVARGARGRANRMGFRCEWQALHGPLCPHQCDDCKDEDLHPMYTPPALTRLAERQFVRINDPTGVPAYHPTEAQPARCGGTEA